MLSTTMQGVEGRNRFNSQALIVAVAIKGDSKSKDLVKWALDKFGSHDHVVFKMLHVHSGTTDLLSPNNFDEMSSPVFGVQEDVEAVSENQLDWKTREMLSVYRHLFEQKQVQSDVLVIQSDNAARAIYQAVNKHRIKKLIIGASAHNMFTRKVKKNNLSSRISEIVPRFCTVYQISRGKISSIRPSDIDAFESMRYDNSERGWSSGSGYHSLSPPTSRTDIISSNGIGSQFHSPSLAVQRLHALSTVNQTLCNPGITGSFNPNHIRFMSWDNIEKDFLGSSSRSGSDASGSTGRGNPLTDNQMSGSLNGSDSSGAYTESFSSGSNMTFDFELEKLKIELRHAQGMNTMAESEIEEAARKLNELNQCRLEEAEKLKELKLKEQEAEELARKEKEEQMAAIKEAEHLRKCAEKEALQRKEAEFRAEHQVKEKQRLENVLQGPLRHYAKFTWEEIEKATSSFSEDLKIGMGSYGSVYKCELHHTTVAVKVLHLENGNMTKQFDQELEILSKIRHPHLLLLLGACPERGCLVYEYMKNGNLEERLLHRGKDASPLPWFERYRIAWEVASALNFLHSTKPKSIVHRDLKPANILLDNNLVSKIGDAGLSKMVNLDSSHASTLYKDSAPVGTFFYIDPEYQRTGFVSPQSDVYAFGIIILQLLTAKPAMGLALMVERSIRNGKLAEIFDSTAGSWPLDETRVLVELGLRCTELRQSDRPNLQTEILPVLESLKGVADTARDLLSNVSAAPPSHFICPILKDVMKDPCVAADGHTYERKAIENWLEHNNISPVTNLPLPNYTLLPNHALHSAITEWKSNSEQPLN